MPSQTFFVPVGTPLLFRPGGGAYSFCAQPGSGGSVLIDYSIDNGFSYMPAAPGAINTPYSFCNLSGVAGAAGVANQGTPVAGSAYAVQGTIVRCTATTAAATFIASDIQVPLDPGTFDKLTIACTGAAYTMPTSTSEQTLWSMRLPPGYFRSGSVWEVIVEGWFTSANTANAKTIKCYVGPSSYVPSTQLEGGTAIGSQVLTSLIGGVFRFGAVGRGDNQTIIGSNTGSAGGIGGSTTANVSVTSANWAGPNAVEQVISLTGTKATGAEALTLDHVRVTLSQ